MSEFHEFLEEQLRDPELKDEYDNMKPEFEVIRALVDARRFRNLTQKELDESFAEALFGL